MDVAAIISVVAFAVVLYLALQMRESIARNYGSNTQKRAWSNIVFGGGKVDVESEEDVEDRVGPSPPLWDTTDLDPPENDEELAERIEFDLGLLQRVREITNGKLSQFHAYNANDDDWVLPTKALAVDVNSDELTKAFNALHDEPFLENHRIFITSRRVGDDTDSSAHIAILSRGDNFEPFRMVPTTQCGDEISPAHVLGTLMAWHEAYPLRIDWAAPDGVEIAFYELPENLDLFLAEEVYPLCPQVLEHNQELASAKAVELGRDRRLTLAWP